MLADFFLLSAIWLILALVLALAIGTRLRRSSFLSSLLYLAILVGIGDLGARVVLGEPPEIVATGSIIVLIAALPLILLLRDWNAPGQGLLLFSMTSIAAYLSYAFVITAFGPLSLAAFLFSFFLLCLEAVALCLSLTFAFEVLDVLCRVRWRNLPPKTTMDSFSPMVSLHVPAYNEPPELVQQTLSALAKLDYPNYEVILVDNNTPDESTWQPLAELCKQLGFKCLHLDRWPGYKSGALNFALTITDPRAEIIGVIDSDYLVRPDYLRRIVPYFQDPEIAFVQTPQDYRDYQQNRFFQAAFDGYKYFFALSMPARNERNAIIFCGTMGLLRKKVLQEIGGWDEWCITEDAEASLRILDRGYKSLFIAETFGRGLMPLDFEGLKKQRFRWAFGGVQILKKHWGKLMPWTRWIDPEGRLTGAQRYFYLVSGLQWFNELITFAFTIMVLVSAALTIAGHTSLLRPTTEAFVILPIVLIGTNMMRALWGLREALAISWKRAIYSLSLWFALTWVVALACVQAVVRRRGVFLRTPKALTNAAWARALQSTTLETILGLTCLLGGLAAMTRAPSLLTGGLMVLCFSQSMIYLSAPSQSLLSLERAPARRTLQPDRGEITGSMASESRVGIQIAAGAFILLLVAFAASLLPVNNTTPSWYGIFNPQPLVAPHSSPRISLPGLPPPALAPVAVPSSTRVSATASPMAAPSGTVPLTPGTTPSPAVTSTTGATATPAASPTIAQTAAPSASPTIGATASPAASPTSPATAAPAASPTKPRTPAPSPAPTELAPPNPGASPTASPTSPTVAN